MIVIMRVQLLIVLVVFSRSIDSAENNSKCKTPDSQNGTCVAVTVAPVEYYDNPHLPNTTICGLVRAVDQIYNGKNAEIGEFPWAAALVYKDKTGTNLGVQCGGTLINKRFVLTAAHCLQNEQQILDFVLLGEWRQSTDPDCTSQTDCADPVLKVGIEREIPHSSYSFRLRNNNIGLIRLIHDVTFTDFIRPICLPPQELPIPKIGEKITVIGWGLTQYNTRSDILLKVDLPLISNSECIEAFRGDKINIDSNKLCFGGDAEEDTCQGDSGGPLLSTYLDINGLRWYQEGVVAFGLECGYGFPAVSTRVNNYINWITQILTDKYD